MQAEEIKFDIIRKCLDRIISNTKWLISLDVVLLLGSFQTSDNISVGQFVIPIKYITISILLVLCYFNLSMSQKFDRIITLYNSVQNCDFKKGVKDYLNLYPSILNPFAQYNDSKFSVGLDSFGLGIQNLAYAMGYSLSFLYFINKNRIVLILFIIGLILLLMFRHDYIIIEKRIGDILDKESRFHKKIVSYLLLVSFFIIWIISNIKIK
jgi:hypothetical protein